MSNEKFKVGDIVRVTKEGSHKFKIGDIVKLVAPKWRAERLDGEYWWVNESEIELIPKNQEPKILITTDRNTTTAKLIDGKKTVKIAEAKCSPNDKFDFMTGAKLAFERLTEEKAELKPEATKEQIKEANGFNVGDDITVIDKSKTYSRYFNDKRCIITPEKYNCGYVPSIDSTAKITNLIEHCGGDGIIAVCRASDGKHDFVIGLKGIKKITEPKEAIKLYCVKDDKGWLTR